MHGALALLVEPWPGEGRFSPSWLPLQRENAGESEDLGPEPEGCLEMKGRCFLLTAICR